MRKQKDQDALVWKRRETRPHGKDVRLWQGCCRRPSWTILDTLIGRTVRTRTTRTLLCCALRMIPSGWSRFLQRQENFKDSPIISFRSLSLHSCQNLWKRPCLFFFFYPPSLPCLFFQKPSRFWSIKPQHMDNPCKFIQYCDIFAKQLLSQAGHIENLNIPLRSCQTKLDMSKSARTKITS